MFTSFFKLLGKGDLFHTSVLVVPQLRRLVAGHAGSVVDKVTLGQVFSEHFGFP
jgi:hypothetical protein